MAILEPLESARGTRRRYRLKSPATLEPIGELEARTAERRARRASSARARRSATGRRCRSTSARATSSARCARCSRAQDEFVAVIRRETGKPRGRGARRSRSSPACDALAFYAKRARRILADRTVPLHLLKTQEAAHLVPAARRGRDHHAVELPVHPRAEPDRAGADRRATRCVLKPSEATPYSGRLVEELFRAAGLPDGRVQSCSATARPGAALRRGGRRQDLVHRQRRDRAQGRRGVRPPADPVHARARRQGSDDRVRGRRPRARRARRRVRRVLRTRARCASRPSASTSSTRSPTSSCARVVEKTGRAAPGRRRRGRRRPDDLAAQLELVERSRARRASRRARACSPAAAAIPALRGPLLRADRARRRRPRHDDHARGDVRPGAADHARARRGRGAPPRERLALRPQRERLDARQAQAASSSRRRSSRAARS